MTKITAAQRVSFSVSKTVNALKWVVISGVASFALTEIGKLLVKSGEGLKFEDYIPLIISAVINILSFAVAKYMEGQDK